MTVSPFPVREVERFVDRRELALMLSVSESTVKRWDVEGCPSVVFGKRTRRYRFSEVFLWAQEQTAA